MNHTADSAKVLKKGWYLELDLTNHAQGFQRTPRPSSLFGLYRILKQAEADKAIRGLVLNTSGFSADRECLWELRGMIASFKTSGKKVVAYFDNADFDLYMLISAADKIVMDEGGSLSFLGYAQGRGYVRRTLEKLGIGVRELRYLDYKSAMETFTRDGFSEADRMQYDAYLNDIFGSTKETLMHARSLQDAAFNMLLQDFLYAPRMAQEQGLVDCIGREEALITIIKELEGDTLKGSCFYGSAASRLLAQGNRSVKKYHLSTKQGLLRKRPEIAIVNALGETDLDRGMAARSLAQTIRVLAEKSRVAGIVLRINSPGGSATAADYVAEAVRTAKEKKPVVVSMGAVAASGGYWAAMYAGHIVASPYTLTGSIGVIAGWFYNKGVYDALGLSVDSLTRGEHADLLAGIMLPQRNLTEAEEERYRLYIMDMYQSFVGKVAAGRNMSVEAVEVLAQGRVYSGLAAQRAGLVDSIGGLHEAVQMVRKLAEIPEKQKIVYREYPKPKLYETLLKQVLSLASGGIKTCLIQEHVPVLEELQYRLSQNGTVMPILPFSVLELLQYKVCRLGMRDS
jgi:protease-4